MLKLSLSLLIAAVCALFALGVVLDYIAGTAQIAEINQPELAQTVLTQLAVEADKVRADQLAATVGLLQQQWQLPLQLVARSSLSLPAELTAQLNQQAALVLDDAEHRLFYHRLMQHPDWLLQLSVPNTEQSQPEDLWLTLTLYLGLCGIMLMWLTPLARRLWQLNLTARAFGGGALHARLPASRWSYIPALEQSFNQMAYQIEQLMADNKLLASSLSHDLRTPIACLRFGLEAALDSDVASQKDQYLQRMEHELDRMEAMVNAFLEFASLERQHLQKMDELDLAQLCRQVMQSCRPLAGKAGVSLEFCCNAEPALLLGDPHWLQRALQNLLQNACRYAVSAVRLELRSQPSGWILQISDDGPGIARVDAERIFQPFVRLEAQSSVKPQFGLGLAIVRKVLEWHQGDITLSRYAPQGASFVLQLPRLSVSD